MDFSISASFKFKESNSSPVSLLLLFQKCISCIHFFCIRTFGITILNKVWKVKRKNKIGSSYKEGKLPSSFKITFSNIRFRGQNSTSLQSYGYLWISSKYYQVDINLLEFQWGVASFRQPEPKSSISFSRFPLLILVLRNVSPCYW